MPWRWKLLLAKPPFRCLARRFHLLKTTLNHADPYYSCSQIVLFSSDRVLLPIRWGDID
jgi:hypothetical protein